MLTRCYRSILMIIWIIIPLSVLSQNNETSNPFKFHREYYYRHEFGISLGLSSDISRHNDLKSFRKDICQKYGLIDEIEHHPHPIQFVGVNGFYSFYSDDCISIGLQIGISYGEYDFLRDIPEYADDYIATFPVKEAGRASSRFWYGMPFARYTWYDNKIFSFYSRIGFGICHQKLRYGGDIAYNISPIEKKKYDVAYHIAPIGISFTAGAFRFFAEAGYNTDGILNLGACIRLGKI